MEEVRDECEEVREKRSESEEVSQEKRLNYRQERCDINRFKLL